MNTDSRVDEEVHTTKDSRTNSSICTIKQGVKEDHYYRMDLVKSTEEENREVVKLYNSSVIYVSFRSVLNLEKEQMEELAWELKGH